MTNRTTALLVCAALSVAGVARAQATQPIPVTDAQMLGIDASIRVSMRALADSAFEAGLSPEPILDLGREGKTKNVPAARVLAAAGVRLHNLRAVQTALGATATIEDINAGAMALGAGANASSLSRIAKERRGSTTLFASFGVLSDLVSFSVPIDTAVRIVTRLAAAGVRDGELSSFRQAVQNDIARGGIPAAAATLRAEGILQTGVRNTSDLDFTAGPGARVSGRARIPPEAN